MFNMPVLPVQASTFAEDVDQILLVLTLLTVFFTGLVYILLVFFAVRYRRGAKVDRSRPVHSDLRIELAWTIIPLIMALGVFFWAAKPYASVFTPPPNCREIFVIGKQWMWHLQHGNGIRENNELHIPVGENIKLTLISQDVIHNFFVPEFRVKRDAIPGRYTNCWFKPTKVGQYHLFCSEYCGTHHSEMIGTVYVMQPADFQAWLASGGSQTATVAQTAGKVETMADAGQKLYTQLVCGSCHDPDGLNRGPRLNGLYGSTVTLPGGGKAIADVEYIRKAIVNPAETVAPTYQQIMPSYKDQLNEDQILQLIAYIKSLPARPTSASATTTSSAKPASTRGAQPAANQ